MKNAYMRDHPAEWKAYHKKWCARNKDKVKGYQKKMFDKGYYKIWVTKNKEHNKIKKAEWYQKNKKRLLKKASDYAKINSEYLNKQHRKYRASEPEKIIAQKVVKKLKKNGVLVPLSCQVCGASKTTAHHEDYSKPANVIWLCRLHHAQADSKRRDRELSIKQIT